MSKKITEASLANNIERTDLVEWRKLKWLQGNLKDAAPEALAKLKASIQKHGLIRSFKVWNGWILDGHLLQKALQEVEAEGTRIPDKLPAEHIRCKNMKEAKALVLVYSSVYHRVDEDEMQVFLSEAGLALSDITEIEIPYLNLDEEKLSDTTLSPPEAGRGEMFQHLNTCPKCGYEWKKD